MNESPDPRSDESHDPESDDAKVKEIQTEEPKAPFGEDEPKAPVVSEDEGVSDEEGEIRPA